MRAREWSRVPAGMADTMQHYLQRIAGTMRPGTVKNAELTLREFALLVAAEDTDVTCVAELKRRHVERYRQWLLERPGCPRRTAAPAHRPLDPALALRAVGSQHVDVEVVVPGEGDRLRVQRHRLTRSDVSAHDRLGAVVDTAHRHPAEVRERGPVAVEERGQVLAGGEAAERVARVRQRHVEGVDLRDADMGEDLALVSPVDLGLSPRDDLEPPVQARQLTRADAQFLRDPGPGFLQIELHPLVVDRAPYSWARRSWITLPLSRISDLSIASISGATSSTPAEAADLLLLSSAARPTRGPSGTC
ncbi:hypothetical protein SSP24_83070 [Streptomyces spinoverrucosus]|uniref:Core-binding (CB) domain-containing protein n=1 Tax=Streptomyces spinoverrucosus TaxID=284043 RepID=A0A4Y3VUK2_9ACTN|nr:hypothetical protein SSP24_83070 [Streptomyces spinoverrucosus]GHB99263.1 hypothetical protein GCM10010397_84430 [Streptomyces spinoverrucosus]